MCIILMIPLLSTMRIENTEFTIHNSQWTINSIALISRISYHELE